MTPEEQDLVLGLVVSPGQGQTRSLDEVLTHFGETDGAALAFRLLRDAMQRQDADDVEMALIVKGAASAQGREFLEPLIELCGADWHYKHEDIVSGLGKYHSSRAVSALLEATRWVPEYLEYDESRALAVKAIWALGGIPGSEARDALTSLLDADCEIVREAAKNQLARRGDH
jgi:hypothetical protein